MPNGTTNEDRLRNMSVIASPMLLLLPLLLEIVGALGIDARLLLFDRVEGL